MNKEVSLGEAISLFVIVSSMIFIIIYLTISIMNVEGEIHFKITADGNEVDFLQLVRHECHPENTPFLVSIHKSDLNIWFLNVECIKIKKNKYQCDSYQVETWEQFK